MTTVRRGGRRFTAVPSSQDRRREAALKKQRESRQHLLNRAREIVSGGISQHEDGDGDQRAGVGLGGGDRTWKASSRSERVRERRRFWASQVCTPEWLVEVPSGGFHAGSNHGSNGGSGSDGGSGGWFVRPRPEGRRCLVAAAEGKTLSRTLDGHVLHRWASCLPFGSPQTNRGHRKGGGSGNEAEGNFVLLDCVFDDATATYWVLDGLAWRHTDLYDSTAEFRFYWVHSKLQEECGGCAEAAAAGGGGEGGRGMAAEGQTAGEEAVARYRIRMAPYYVCDAQGLEQAYRGAQPFLRDGLLFYHRLGRYEPGRPTPLVLQWKDQASSRYLLYSDKMQAVLMVAVAPEEKEQGGDGELDGMAAAAAEEEEPLPAAAAATWGLDAARGWRRSGGGGGGLGLGAGGGLAPGSSMGMPPGGTGGCGGCGCGGGGGAAAAAAAESAPALALATLEGLVVGRLDGNLAAQHKVAPGDLLKFHVDGAHETAAEAAAGGGEGQGRFELVNPVFAGRCSPNRALADSWTKLVFQSRVRAAGGSAQPSVAQVLAACTPLGAHPPLHPPAATELLPPPPTAVPVEQGAPVHLPFVEAHPSGC